MAIDAIQTVTNPIATTTPKEAPKAAETTAPAATPAAAETTAPVAGESIATATPTEAQAKKVDVTV